MADILSNREEILVEIEEIAEEISRRKSPSATSSVAATGASVAAKSLESISRLKVLDDEALFRKLIEVETSIYGPARSMECHQFVNASTVRQERRQASGSRAPNVLEQNSDAVVALVKKENLLAQGDGGVRLSAPTTQEIFDLCPEELFHNRLAAAQGSGVLVGNRTILTARHLFSESLNLSSFVFLLGYERSQIHFTEQEVFDGALAHVTAESPAAEEDWVLIELDREVGREPVEARTNGQIGDRDEVYVVGHPLGISKQAAGDAQVQSNSDPVHFFANLDVYERNSGSPVFNAVDHRLEGIVIAGDSPLFPVPWRPCKRTRRCRGRNCQGPAILRISRITSAEAFQNRN